MEPIGIAVFAATWVLVSFRRLTLLGFDRPAGALAGAVACVAFGVLTPADAFAAVDGATLLLLFALMGLGALLAADGLFTAAEAALVRRARSPRALLGGIVWGSGLLSAVITNDAVCVLGAPVVVGLVRRHRLPPLPFLLALATAANTGSAATLVGNPQNMLCGLLGSLSYLDHLAKVGPAAVLGLAINHGILLLAFRRALHGARLEPDSAPPPATRAAPTLATLAGVAIAWSLGTDLAWTAAGGFVTALLVRRRDSRELWSRIDWSVLLFFAGLFVVVAGLVHSGAPAAFFAEWPLAGVGEGPGGPFALAFVFLGGSNVVSNVPFILVVRDEMATLPDPEFGWELLAMASTFAGNLTLLGSVANIIVAESARDVGGIGFFAYLRVGLPIALATTLVGVAWLLLVA